jgi:diguanylate cyclase (GGDEF)-like protein/PAS domain S-box-containing protein
MSPVRPEALASTVLRGRLPLKITGIVFWGMMLVGLLFSLIQLRTLEDQLIGRHALNADRFSAAIVEYFAINPQLSPAQAQDTIHQLLNESGFTGVILHTAEGAYRFGDTRAGTEYRNEPVPDHAVADADHGIVRLQFYHRDIHELVNAKRKELLITMGALFLAFGFILQWILQRVLTRPFLNMVHTAERFAGGMTEARFDEQRHDEFGFLGKFFNKALDYLLVQQDELREALNRVRESETALYQEKERAEVTLYSIGDAVITTDEAGRIDYLNPVAERLTGWTLEDKQGKPLGDVMRLVNENSREPVANPVELCLKCGEILELADHTLLIRDDGEEVAIADSAAPIRDRAGSIIGAVMVFHDVGHARKLARQLSYQATHDALTGLYNRRAFEDQLKDALLSARDEGREHALCYLDLDQFKVVNDTCGHIAGDEMLKQLAHLLQSKVREADVLARLGGDEFGVLLRYCTLDQARGVAEDLRRSVRDYRFICEDHSFETGVSIGVVSVTGQTHTLTEIQSAADVACYAAKEAGRNRVHVYVPDDRELQQRQGEMRWVSRIHKAMAEDRFMLYCQPILPVDPHSGLAPHYEFLLRIQGEDGQEVPPMAFIPAAERYNLMPMIDRWVVQNVLRNVARATPSLEGAIWTINISGRSLGDEDFLQLVSQEVEAADIPGGQICFEITETAAIANLRRAARFIKMLKARGCRFALDDFGSGLSSFAYLKNLEVDYLKIDGSFVRDIATDPIDRAMVEAINSVGHVMQIRTIAEFVENQEILAVLRELGVDYAQGYGIARPQSFEELLESRRRPAFAQICNG